MRRILLFAVSASALACNSIAGISELKDHPCAQEICPDTSVVVGDGDLDTATIDTEVPDTFIADTAMPDTAMPDTVMADTAMPETGLDGGVCGGAPAPLVTVIAGSGGYAIAATEVTRAQYAAFLAAAPSIAQPAECSWNTSFVPTVWTAPSASTECSMPVAYVDWCDAWSYCKWAGRRLCGRIGTGAGIDGGDGSLVKDPAVSEWHRVCTNNGTTKQSYGPDDIAGTCVDYDYDGASGYNSSTDVARPVASASACKGVAAPYSSVFDMTGNLREWENACDSSAIDSLCRARGGSFTEDSLGCNTGWEAKRNDHLPYVGIRCCSTL